VMSEHAFTEEKTLKDGIAKEVALADSIKKKLKAENFIIPIRIDKVDYADFPIDFIRLNGIDCSDNWANGLSKLLKVLERDETPQNPESISPTLNSWREIHQHKSQALTISTETVQTNWLKMISMPDEIHFYHILISVKPSEPRAIASECTLPCVDHARLLASFSNQADLQEALGEKIPIKLRATLKTENFLKGLTGDVLNLAPKDARRKLSSLVRQGLENFFRDKKLAEYEMASGNLAWWFLPGMVEKDRLTYVDFSGKSRYRAVTGRSGKKEDESGNEVVRYYWHLGFTVIPMISDSSMLVLKPRIIVTDDQKTPLENKTRLNSARRSITKMWFNDKWRGMVLGFSQWMGNGESTISIPMGSGREFCFECSPQVLTAPVSIRTDPVLDSLSDETAAIDERNEINFRLTDPVFKLDDEDTENEF